jgi:hypothetical protein
MNKVRGSEGMTIVITKYIIQNEKNMRAKPQSSFLPLMSPAFILL